MMKYLKSDPRTPISYLIFLLFLLSSCQAQPESRAETTAVPDLSSYPFAYLRDGRPIMDEERMVSVIIVGDVLLGRGVAAQDDPLGLVGGRLGEADLALGNLEGVPAAGENPRRIAEGEGKPIILQAGPQSAALLAEAGLDIVGLANNHSLDFGAEGLLEGIGHLQRAGLAVLGVEGEETAVQPHYVEIDGLRLAFLAFNAVPDPLGEPPCPTQEICVQPAAWDPPRSLAAITAAQEQADAVIVSIHWGYEYQPQPDPFQETAAQEIFAAGADLIAGHHAHVPQRIGVNGRQVVAYSLGNFLFDQGQEETGRGLALRAFFDEAGLRAVQVLPLRAGVQPRLLDLNAAEDWLAPLLPAAERTAFSCTDAGCVPTNAPETQLDARFFSGQIDLTGDGLPETVRREGERITVYEGSTAVWTSPEAWRVVDVALGDPNDDGRYEIMLAIRQEDAGGYERSQPYIVGHRGGRYDLLWGGRPLADPILELEVGDVDGDGTDELIVIEELADGSGTAVSVWRWAGWTFTKVWRSALGTYADLLLLPGQKPTISVRTAATKILNK